MERKTINKFWLILTIIFFCLVGVTLTAIYTLHDRDLQIAVVPLELELGESLTEEEVLYCLKSEENLEKVYERETVDISEVNIKEPGEYQAQINYKDNVFLVPIIVADTLSPQIIIVKSTFPASILIGADDIAQVLDESPANLFLIDDYGDETSNVITTVGMAVTLKAIDEYGNEMTKYVRLNIIPRDADYESTESPEIVIVRDLFPVSISIGADDIAHVYGEAPVTLSLIDESGNELGYVMTEVGMTVTLKAVDKYGNEAVKTINPNIIAQDTEFEPRERHTYNASDPDKNLFLQFINDEIPLINYEGKGVVYYSELNAYEDIYCIVDMDGDGINEFCFNTVVTNNVIKYNEEKQCFEIWTRARFHARPIGNGRMYEMPQNIDLMYRDYSYDKNGNLVKEKLYTIWDPGTDKVQYTLDGRREVSKEEWEKATAEYFEAIENAPPTLTYEQLLE